MTAPRQILPGKTYFVTRRCARREFLLRPCEITNAIFEYVLAVAAQRTGVVLHAYCVMSNHVHLVLTDPEAKLPAFAQYLGAMVARALNAAFRDKENLWDVSGYSAVTLAGPEDVVDKTAYVLANPVAAGLVARGREWPGLWSDPARFGCAPTVVKRPDAFFRSEGPTPDAAELHLAPPPGFYDGASFAERVCAAVTAREEEARRTMRREGRRFLGSAAVRAQPRKAKPRTEEKRGKLNPRVAARDPWKRAETLGRLKQFLDDYRAAWSSFAAGIRDVVFPAGTYAMRVLHSVACAPA